VVGNTSRDLQQQRNTMSAEHRRNPDYQDSNPAIPSMNDADREEQARQFALAEYKEDLKWEKWMENQDVLREQEKRDERRWEERCETMSDEAADKRADEEEAKRLREDSR
jgi:hypothetical protein